MKRSLIAIFLGWAGGYRFYKRQWLWGFIYLCTFGVFGLGWLLDIILAISADIKYNKPLVIECDIRGGFAESKKYPQIKRRDFLTKLQPGTPLRLEESTYHGKPFFLICDPDGHDLGAMPSEINEMLRRDYQGAKVTAYLTRIEDPTQGYMKLTVKR